MFPLLPDDVWRLVKTFLIHDPHVAALKRRLNDDIERCFYIYVSGFSEFHGIIRHYYYLMTPVGHRAIIDYCGLPERE